MDVLIFCAWALLLINSFALVYLHWKIEQLKIDLDFVKQFMTLKKSIEEDINAAKMQSQAEG